MSDKELSKYFHYRREAEDLKRRIDELGIGVSSIEVRDVITQNSGSHNSIQEKIALLKDKYFECLKLAIDEYYKIEEYIEVVDDSEIRTIMRYRYLDLMTWEDIGEAVHMERTTVSKKLRNYLKGVNRNDNKYKI